MSSWSIKRKKDENRSFRKWKIKKRTRVRSEKDNKEPVNEDKEIEQTEKTSDPTAEETDMSEINKPKYEPEEQVPAKYSDDDDIIMFHNGEFVFVENKHGIDTFQKDDNPYDHLDEIGLYRCFLYYYDDKAFLGFHMCYFNSDRKMVYLNMIEYASVCCTGELFINNYNEYDVHYYDVDYDEDNED